MSALRLAPDTIHIWLLDISYLYGLTHQHTALNTLEQNRAGRLIHTHKQHNYIATRSTLRYLLSEYLQQPPHALTLTTTSHGKPIVPEAPYLHFNVSHSANMVAYAFTQQYQLGIDIEKISPIDTLALAQRYFHDSEYKKLQMIPTHQRINIFYGMWTQKEAIYKANGHGLRLPLNSFIVSGENNYPEMIEYQSLQWWLLPTPSPAGYRTALACCKLIKKIHYYNQADYRNLQSNP